MDMDDPTKENVMAYAVAVILLVVALLAIDVYARFTIRRKERRNKFFDDVQKLDSVGDLDELRKLLEKEKGRWGKDARIRRRELQFRIRLLELDKARQVGPEALNATLNEILHDLKSSRVDVDEIMRYAVAASALDYQTGSAFLFEVAKILRRSLERKNRALAVELLQQARWLKLEGNEFEFEGILNDQTELDWGDYRGVVTLVFGWNSGDRDSLFMLPIVRALYRKYHSEGFEVLGYNSEDSPRKLKKLEKEFRIPWKNVSRRLSRRARKDSGERYQDFKELWGRYCFAILVDIDGKVRSLCCDRDIAVHVEGLLNRR